MRPQRILLRQWEQRHVLQGRPEVLQRRQCRLMLRPGVDVLRPWRKRQVLQPGPDLLRFREPLQVLPGGTVRKHPLL